MENISLRQSKVEQNSVLTNENDLWTLYIWIIHKEKKHNIINANNGTRLL